MPKKGLKCPAPPSTFKTTPSLVVYEEGASLYRVHQQKYAATAFNPGKGQPGRFSPIYNSQTSIPTLYAGSSKQSALAESIFRNKVSTSPAITRRSLRDQRVTLFFPKRDLTLVDLTENGLRRLGLKRNQLLETEQDC